MHHWISFIFDSERRIYEGIDFGEIIIFLWVDIFRLQFDVFVAIESGLRVFDAKRMQRFMLDATAHPSLEKRGIVWLIEVKVGQGPVFVYLCTLVMCDRVRKDSMFMCDRVRKDSTTVQYCMCQNRFSFSLYKCVHIPTYATLEYTA